MAEVARDVGGLLPQVYHCWEGAGGWGRRRRRGWAQVDGEDAMNVRPRKGEWRQHTKRGSRACRASGWPEGGRRGHQWRSHRQTRLVGVAIGTARRGRKPRLSRRPIGLRESSPLKYPSPCTMEVDIAPVSSSGAGAPNGGSVGEGRGHGRHDGNSGRSTSRGALVTRECCWQRFVCSMPRGRGAEVVARKRGRALYALTKECAVIVANVRAFFERERDVRRSRALSNEGSYRPGGEPERRASSRRVPAEERARVREAIVQQFENRSVPKLDSTFLYLSAKRAAGRSDVHIMGSFDWFTNKTSLCACTSGPSAGAPTTPDEMAASAPHLSQSYAGHARPPGERQAAILPSDPIDPHPETEPVPAWVHRTWLARGGGGVPRGERSTCANSCQAVGSERGNRKFARLIWVRWR